MSETSDEIHRELEWYLSHQLNELGFILWSFEEVGRHSRSPVLRVYIDRENGVSVEDCAFVNLALRKVSALENLMGGDYQLEVSSPGVFRELSRPEHFQRYIGSRVRVFARGYPPIIGSLRSFSRSLFVIEQQDLTHFIPRSIVVSVNAEPILKI